LHGLSQKLEETSSFALQDLRNEKARFILSWLIHLSSTLIFGYLNIKIGKTRNEDFNTSLDNFIEVKPGFFFG